MEVKTGELAGFMLVFLSDTGNQDYDVSGTMIGILGPLIYPLREVHGEFQRRKKGVPSQP